MGAMFFIGWCSTLLWMPQIADKYGRKRLFWIAVLVDLVLYTCLFFTHSLGWMIFIWTVLGAMNSWRTTVGYVYIMECVPKKAQTPVTSLWNVQEGGIYLLATLYFWKVSKHWFWFSLVGYIWNIISAVFMIWMPESPRYLVNSGQLQKAAEAFRIVAWFNKKELVWDESKFVKNGESTQKGQVFCSQESTSFQ